jgi:hypothetical protein
MNIKKHIIRQKISTRGGGIEISLRYAGYSGEKMTAYQNYLGGGILGKICNDCTIRNWQTDPKLVKIAEELKEYFHEQTNPESEWESMTFEQNQNLPISAY